jgi:hypothetical protein
MPKAADPFAGITEAPTSRKTADGRPIHELDTGTIPVTLTGTHLADGKANSSTDCAFALAIKPMPGVTGVHVWRKRVYIDFTDRQLRCALRKESTLVVVLNDIGGGKLAKPGQYVLHPISMSERFAGKAEKNKRQRLGPKNPHGKPSGPKSSTGDYLTVAGVRSGVGQVHTKSA